MPSAVHEASLSFLFLKVLITYRPLLLSFCNLFYLLSPESATALFWLSYLRGSLFARKRLPLLGMLSFSFCVELADLRFFLISKYSLLLLATMPS